MCPRNSRLFSHVTVWGGLVSHTGFVSFVFLVFHLALIFRPSLCRYLMELCHNVRCCVRWQQSPWVKAAVSSRKKKHLWASNTLVSAFLLLVWLLQPPFFCYRTPMTAPGFVLKCQSAVHLLKRWRWLRQSGNVQWDQSKGDLCALSIVRLPDLSDTHIPVRS